MGRKKTNRELWMQIIAEMICERDLAQGDNVEDLLCALITLITDVVNRETKE